MEEPIEQVITRFHKLMDYIPSITIYDSGSRGTELRKLCTIGRSESQIIVNELI